MDLKTLIDSEPANATRTDQQVLDWLLAPVTVQRDATNGDVLTWAAGNDMIKRLRDYAAGASAAERGLANAALVRIDAGLGLSLTDAKVQSLLSNMVALGMMTQVEADDLNAQAQEQAPRWQAQPLSDVRHEPTVHEVGVARGTV